MREAGTGHRPGRERLDAERELAAARRRLTEAEQDVALERCAGTRGGAYGRRRAEHRRLAAADAERTARARLRRIVHETALDDYARAAALTRLRNAVEVQARAEHVWQEVLTRVPPADADECAEAMAARNAAIGGTLAAWAALAGIDPLQADAEAEAGLADVGAGGAGLPAGL